jgi:hypothetical protein
VLIIQFERLRIRPNPAGALEHLTVLSDLTQRLDMKIHDFSAYGASERRR